MFNLGNVESEKTAGLVKPGEAVAVVLKKVEITPEGDLDFVFEGTDPANAGIFKPRFWANNLDPANDKYDVTNAENLLKQIKQIMEAYLSPAAIAKIQGRNAAEFFAAIRANLTPNVTNVPATMKIVYKYNSDTLCVLPKFGEFISTELKPRALKLRNGVDANKVPYERVLPLATYGVTAPAKGEAGAGSESPFGAVAPESDDEAPFGN